MIPPEPTALAVAKDAASNLRQAANELWQLLGFIEACGSDVRTAKTRPELEAAVRSGLGLIAQHANATLRSINTAKTKLEDQ